MAKVLGIGGVFFKAKDADALNAWYRDVIGVAFEEWGGAIFQPRDMEAHAGACTVFSAFKSETTYMEPSPKDFMINFAVDDLDGVLARCAEHGVQPEKLMDEPNGRFAHILDPEGTKIELWEPKPMDDATTG